MDHYVVELGKRIKKQRIALKLTQAQLAEKAGISAQYVSHIEKGDQQMSVAVFSRVCDALAISADKLLYNRSPESQRQLSEEVDLLLAVCSPAERNGIVHLVQEMKQVFKELKEMP